MISLVLYKFVGFALSDDDVFLLAARLLNRDDSYYSSQASPSISNAASIIAIQSENSRIALGTFTIQWPENCTGKKAGRHWMLIILLEPSLTETIDDFTSVPYPSDESDPQTITEEKAAVEWMMKYNFKEELRKRWTTVPRQWAPASYDYPLRSY